MKFKRFKRFIIGGFAVAAMFGMASCSNEKANNDSFINETNEKLAFEATTALAMVDSEETAGNSATNVVIDEASAQDEVLTEEQAPAQDETPDDTLPSEDEKEESLPDIIDQADLIINNDAEFSISSGESDKAEYSNLSFISFKDHEGTVHSISLYYNDVIENVTNEDDEVETKISYRGLVIYNGMEYTFDFASKTEAEDDELEVNTKLIIYTGDNSYISIKNETETEEDEHEDEFAYKVVVDGKTLNSYTVSHEFEDGKTKVMVKLNGETYKLAKKIKDGNVGIMVEIGKNGLFYERFKDKDGKNRFHFNAKFELDDLDIQNIKDFIESHKSER